MNVDHGQAVIAISLEAVQSAMKPLIEANGNDASAAFLVAGGAVKFLGSILAYIDEGGVDSTPYRQLMINILDETRAQIAELRKATLQ